MVCPWCGTPFEGRFCPSCGKEYSPPPPVGVATAASPPTPPSAPSFSFTCARCGSTFAGPWCPVCGLPAGAPRPGAGFRIIGSVVWTMSMLAFFALLVANLVGLGYASQIVVTEALRSSVHPLFFFLLLPFPVGPVYDVTAQVFLAYFAVIVTVIVAGFVWYAIRDAKPTAEAFARPLERLRERLESRSAWISTAQVFLAVLFFEYAFYFVYIALFGEPSSALSSYPDWYLYFSLANAPVYEELVSRLLLIGVPLAIVALAVRSFTTPTPAAGASVSPVPWWRHLLGGTVHRTSPRWMLTTSVVLVSVSAVVFALAHVPGYGWWKFVPTVAAGLGMGYLFLRRGLFAAILFHFATDYMAAVLLLIGDQGIAAQLAFGVFILIMIGLGFLFFLWYGIHALELGRHLASLWGIRLRAAPAAVAPYPAWGAPPLPPPYGYGPPAPPGASVPPPQSPGAPPVPAPVWIPFVCQRCGWREARYDAGVFTCLRCGQAAR